jgi:hypothetical protein
MIRAACRDGEYSTPTRLRTFLRLPPVALVFWGHAESFSWERGRPSRHPLMAISVTLTLPLENASCKYEIWSPPKSPPSPVRITLHFPEGLRPSGRTRTSALPGTYNNPWDYINELVTRGGQNRQRAGASPCTHRCCLKLVVGSSKRPLRLRAGAITYNRELGVKILSTSTAEWQKRTDAHGSTNAAPHRRSGPR